LTLTDSSVGDPRITSPLNADVVAPTGVTLTAVDALLVPAELATVAVHE
jgi:hypothetical protein